MGKTRFQIAVEFLEPYDGELIPVNGLRMLIMRNLGTSVTSVGKHVENLVAWGLVFEEEEMKYRVKIPDHLALKPSQKV